MRYHELTQWEERLTIRELPQREEQETYSELSQWGGLRGQELPQWEDVGVQELTQQEGQRYHDLPQQEDVGACGLYQWEDKKDSELFQVVDKTDKDQPQKEEYGAQELSQREGMSDKRLSQGGADVGYSSWDKPVSAGDTLAVPQERPSSPSSVGTAVAAEAAQDLPSPAPAPLSPTEAEPAAPAPDGAAEQEEPQEPVASEETKAEGSPSFGELVPSAGTESPVPAPQSPSEGSQALLGQQITIEIVSEAELEIEGSEQQLEEQGAMEQTTAAEMQETAAGIESLVPPSRSPSEGSQALLDMAELMTTEILTKAELEIQGSEQQLEKQGDLEETTAAEMQERASWIESPVPAPQSPSEGSQVLLDIADGISTEILKKAELEIQGSSQEQEEQGDLDQSTATELLTIPAESTESPVSAPLSPCSPPSPVASSLEVLVASEHQDTEERSVLSVQETEEGTLAGEEKEWKSSTDQDTSQGEEVRDPQLSQWEEDITSNISDKALGPGNQEDAQPVTQERPSSPSSVGTAVAAEAAQDLPSPAPAPLSPTEAEPAAPAPDGAAEQEEPQEPVAPEETKAEGSPSFGELVPSAGTESPVPAPQSPSEGSQALLGTDQEITPEILSEPELVVQGSGQEVEEQGDLEQSTAAEMQETAAGIESPVPAPQSPSEGSQALLGSDHQITPEILSEAELVMQGSEQQLEEQGDLEQATDTETVTTFTAEREGSLVPALQSPSEGSQALLDTDQSSTSEVLIKAKLKGSGQEREEQEDLEQTWDTETISTFTAEREGSLVLAPRSPCSPFSLSAPSLEAQALREQQEEAERGSFLSVQDTEEGAVAGEGQDWKYYVDQEIFQWEDEEEQDLSQEETKTYQQVSQGGERREQEPSPGPVKSHQELSDWDEYSEEEEPQGEVKSYREESDWEENIKQEQSQGKKRSFQEVSDWEECSEEELSHRGAKSYQEVSDWEENMEKEQSQAESKRRQEVSGWEENMEKEQSQGESKRHQEISDWEDYSEEELSHGDVKSYQEVSDWEENIKQEGVQRESRRCQEVSDWEEYIEEEQSRAEVKSYQEVSDWEENLEQGQSQEVKKYKKVADWEELSDSKRELFHGEVKIRQEPSDWEESSEEEQFQRKVSTFQKLLKWEESSEEEQSHGNGSSYPELTESEETSMEGQFQGKFSGFQELLSDWEDSIAEELSEDEDSFGQEFSDWEVYRPSILSRWEDDSDRELTLLDWERMTIHSFGVKPLRPEEDEWEELSFLELSQGQGTEHRLGILAEEGLPMPVPREAWAERRVCASPPRLAAQIPRGAAAPPALDKWVAKAEAGTRSQGPAPERPCRPPSPCPPQLEVQAPRGAAAPLTLRKQVAEAATQTWLPRKRPSRFRQMLRALGRLFGACVPGQLED
ncbi:retinitis pigmentosa 1-like 1 protein isoform X8 [Manacus candei]|uniref:retinitis pigmentosa 1-like 1 protein isoform X8 n=1 Tax=Manacus candei TaxID=415023 RepID=UPI002226D5F8|nr:retinitis pigmentosa 1-like 1 protein isoform X8 [Manacus candei]